MSESQEEAMQMQEAIQDLMNRGGFEALEARAYYHLTEARHAFEEMVLGEDPHAGRMATFTTVFLPAFATLRNDIRRRVWERDHPLNEKE